MTTTTILSDNGVSSGSAGIKTTGGNDGTLQLQTTTAGGTATTAVTIDTSQNVGVGTSSPTRKFDVNGAIGSTYSTANDVQVALIPNYSSTVNFINSTYTSTGSYLPLAFGTGGAERTRIDTSGNFYVAYGGQTTTAFTAPQGISLGGPDSTALQYYIRKGNQVEAHIGFKASTDTNFYVGSGGGSGAAGIGAYGLYQVNQGVAWVSTSDERFKTELEPIENALEKIAGVRAVTGRYTYDEENNFTKRRPFLIAQDFLTALPEAVDTQDPEKLGLSYSDTVPLLFAAIKEQQALITTLTERIAALEAK